LVIPVVSMHVAGKFDQSINSVTTTVAGYSNKDNPIPSQSRPDLLPQVLQDSELQALFLLEETVTEIKTERKVDHFSFSFTWGMPRKTMDELQAAKTKLIVVRVTTILDYKNQSKVVGPQKHILLNIG